MNHRVKRLAQRLISALEDYTTYDDSQIMRSKNPQLREESRRHLQVAESKKTKEKLEKWFRLRKIPIRIIYGGSIDWNQGLSPISRPGVITFQYKYVPLEPPTAWMILHNLSHAIFDKGVGRYNNFMEKMSQKMSLGHQNHGQWIEKQTYPTTRSFHNNKITSVEEAFQELFAQWVSTGRVTLQGDQVENLQAWETELAAGFRQAVNELAAQGAVLENV